MAYPDVRGSQRSTNRGLAKVVRISWFILLKYFTSMGLVHFTGLQVYKLHRVPPILTPPRMFLPLLCPDPLPSGRGLVQDASGLCLPGLQTLGEEPPIPSPIRLFVLLREPLASPTPSWSHPFCVGPNPSAILISESWSKYHCVIHSSIFILGIS